MNANEMADLMILFDSGRIYEHAEEIANMLRQQQNELDAFKLQYYNTGYSIQLKDKDETIRQQQAEIEDLNKENTDLRYLIATKLEQQE
jgi:vacuolar-type H+-ATPase subunit I/STV1